jgi:hypothetical protein
LQQSMGFRDDAKIPINRVWAMPNADTFDCPPIGAFVRRYLAESKVSVDPFARNNRWCTYTNDLDLTTKAYHHLEASEFLAELVSAGTMFDLGIFDPPYSSRQLQECYNNVGRAVTTEDTQSRTWARWKDLLGQIISPGGVALSFGWNSGGLGKGRGFSIIEILLVASGGLHNDTICVAERKTNGIA